MRSTAIDLLECVEAATNEARSAYNTAVRAAVQQQLANMPVDKLKDVSQGRLHLNAMKRAGYRTFERSGYRRDDCQSRPQRRFPIDDGRRGVNPTSLQR